MSEAPAQNVEKHAALIGDLIAEVGKVLVGQEPMVSRLLIGLLTGGHVLLEGVPGLAKTLTVRCLAQTIDTGFSRIQFTPDMLPADVIGTEVFNPRDATYSVKKGPVFSNLVSPTRSTARPPRCRPRCSRPCRSARSPSGTPPTDSPTPSCAGHPEPHRAGGHLPAARGPGRPLHAEGEGGLPQQGRGAAIIDRMASAGSPRCAPSPAGGDPRGREGGRPGLRGRQGLGYIVDLVHATRDPVEAGLADLDGMIELWERARARRST